MEFVSFEIAKKLKEKGYPQVKKNTIAMYNEVGNWYSLVKNLADFEYSFEDFDEHDYVCPTISQVLKWLRKEKKIHIIIPASSDESYWWEARDFNREISEYYDTEYTSYEEAALAGIEYVLDTRI
jgi:hypothetical protein